MMMITRRFWPRRVFGRERDDGPLDAANFADGPLRREADGLPFLRPRRIAGDRDEGLRPRDIDSADRVRRHERYAAGTGNLFQSLQDIRFIRHGRCSSPIALACVLRRMGAKIHRTIDAIAKPVARRDGAVSVEARSLRRNKRDSPAPADREHRHRSRTRNSRRAWASSQRRRRGSHGGFDMSPRPSSASRRDRKPGKSASTTVLAARPSARPRHPRRRCWARHVRSSACA